MAFLLCVPKVNIIIVCYVCGSGEHPYAQVGANNMLDSTVYDLTLGYGNHRASVQ
jgi:hypothetical protein